MSFCKYGSEVIPSKEINISNIFINEYMPLAPESATKVYLYGLSKCANPDSFDNTIEGFCKALNLSNDDVMSCFLYWQEQGIVQVLNSSPLEIRYLTIKSSSTKLKKFNTDKYLSFNTQAQEILSKRMITPNEYQEYYYLMESLHINEDALLMIMKYCTELKGENVGYSYILTVAKNWAYDGITTIEDVERRLHDQKLSDIDIKSVLKELGINRQATNDEYQLFLSWTKDFEIPLDIILFLAKRQGKSNGGMLKLNHTVAKCYTLKLESTKEILDYFEKEKELHDIAKDVCRALGIWYDNLEVVVDTYINNWVTLGFDKETIIKIANYCFKTTIKTLEGMNAKINQLFKLGLLTSEDIDSYISKLIENDDEISNILNALGLTRAVNQNDRLLFKTWIYDWKLDYELIVDTAKKSADKYLPMQYLNKVLSYYHNENITTLANSKGIKLPSFSYAKSTDTKKPAKRDYTQKELDSLFDNIYEVEI